MPTDPVHDWRVIGGSCRPGCLLAASEQALAARARKYGVNVSDLVELVAVTAGICMVCRRCHATVVEHCHQTRRVGGLVCAECNARIGHLEGTQYWPPVYTVSCSCLRVGDRQRVETCLRRAWWLEQATYQFLDHAMDDPRRDRRGAFAQLAGNPYPRGDLADVAAVSKLPPLRDGKHRREAERLIADGMIIAARAAQGASFAAATWERRAREQIAADVRTAYQAGI